MGLDKMAEVEARVRSLVALVQQLKTRNAQLERDLRLTKDRLLKHAEVSRRWEEERSDIRSRVEKVLAELEVFECLQESRVSKEVALD